jgi:hypothetical protein
MMSQQGSTTAGMTSQRGWDTSGTASHAITSGATAALSVIKQNRKKLTFVGPVRNEHCVLVMCWLSSTYILCRVVLLKLFAHVQNKNLLFECHE